MNRAARLEGSAEPAGIAVSGRVQGDCEGRLDVGFADEAAKYLALLRQLNPGLRISNTGERITLRRALDRERLTEGLRKAGLPE